MSLQDKFRAYLASQESGGGSDPADDDDDDEAAKSRRARQRERLRRYEQLGDPEALELKQQIHDRLANDPDARAVVDLLLKGDARARALAQELRSGAHSSGGQTDQNAEAAAALAQRERALNERLARAEQRLTRNEIRESLSELAAHRVYGQLYDGARDNAELERIMLRTGATAIEAFNIGPGRDRIEKILEAVDGDENPVPRSDRASFTGTRQETDRTVRRGGSEASVQEARRRHREVRGGDESAVKTIMMNYAKRSSTG